MTQLINLDEEAIEAAYWQFDSDRKARGDERLRFKEQMRAFARNMIRQHQAGKLTSTNIDASSPQYGERVSTLESVQ